MNSISYNKSLLSIGLLIFRVFLGVAMISHGFPKLIMLFGDGKIQFMSFLGLTPAFTLGLVVFAEFLCSIFLILGLFTRPVLVPLIITMLVAVFAVHLSDPFDKMEMALHYLFGYILLFIAGPGKISVDAMIGKNKNTW